MSDKKRANFDAVLAVSVAIERGTIRNQNLQKMNEYIMSDTILMTSCLTKDHTPMQTMA